MARAFRIIVKVMFQKIRKKENLKYGKHNKQLDCQYNQQTFSGNANIPEPVNINSV
jgi:hypothetical protein